MHVIHDPNCHDFQLMSNIAFLGRFPVSKNSYKGVTELCVFCGEIDGENGLNMTIFYSLKGRIYLMKNLQLTC